MKRIVVLFTVLVLYALHTIEVCSVMKLLKPEKLVLVSDTQIHRWPQFSRFSKSGRIDRLEHCLAVFQQIKDYCLQHKIYLVIFAGDLFQEIGEQATEVTCLTYRAIKALGQAGITVLMIPGNHDVGDEMLDTHALEVFSNLPNVYVYAKPEAVWSVFDKLVFHLIPWVKSPTSFLTSLKMHNRMAVAQPEKRHIVVCHQGFRGGSISGDEGYDPKDGFTLSQRHLRGFLAGFSGHYHPHKKVDAMPIPWWQIGSGNHHTKGDKEDLDKGFLDVRVLGNNVTVTKVKVTGTPEFREFNIETKGDLKEVQALNLLNDFVYINLKTKKLSKLTDSQLDIKSRELRVTRVREIAAAKKEHKLSLHTDLLHWIDHRIQSSAGEDELLLKRLVREAFNEVAT